jgi:hypothetical protein
VEKIHPGSGSRIPDPGGKKAPDPGSGSATLNRRQKIEQTILLTYVRYKNIKKICAGVKSVALQLALLSNLCSNFLENCAIYRMKLTRG